MTQVEELQAKVKGLEKKVSSLEAALQEEWERFEKLYEAAIRGEDIYEALYGDGYEEDEDY